MPATPPPPKRLATPLALLLAALASLLAISTPARAAAPAAASRPAVDATTMHRKVLTGYQGWFRCPNDPANEGWRHWSRNGRRIAPETLTIEMWPDMTEYAADERFPADAFTTPDGRPATLFSSAHPATVDRHFRWMEQYGIDGAFVQRFLVDARRPSADRVLTLTRAAAAKSGRAYALCYDLSGANKDKLYDQLVADWKRLVDDARVTADDRYLHHNGKPVLFVWGFYSDRFDAALAHKVIDFFKSDPKYAVTLIGGCQWYWRREKDPEWSRAFRRFDIISPWNVGHTMQVAGQKHAATTYWADDIAEARRAGMTYLPVIYPGFGWTNLKGKDAARATIPRLGGEFFWRQFVTAANMGIEMAYVAMFDEVDEATAIFKVTNAPPTQAPFATYDGLPSDWYLRLAGEGTKVIRSGARPVPAAIPIRP